MQGSAVVPGGTFRIAAETFAIGHGVVLPAEAASHNVTQLEIGMARLDHLPDRKGLDDIAKGRRRSKSTGSSCSQSSYSSSTSTQRVYGGRS
jgi:hypothetical protein